MLLKGTTAWLERRLFTATCAKPTGCSRTGATVIGAAAMVSAILGVANSPAALRLIRGLRCVPVGPLIPVNTALWTAASITATRCPGDSKAIASGPAMTLAPNYVQSGTHI